jgi:hypothetical protein
MDRIQVSNSENLPPSFTNYSNSQDNNDLTVSPRNAFHVTTAVQGIHSQIPQYDNTQTSPQ